MNDDRVLPADFFMAVSLSEAQKKKWMNVHKLIILCIVQVMKLFHIVFLGDKTFLVLRAANTFLQIEWHITKYFIKWVHIWKL